MKRDGSVFFRAREVKVTEAPELVASLRREYESAFGVVTPRGVGALSRGTDTSRPAVDAGQEADKAGGDTLDDARVLWIDYDAQGQRYKGWRGVVQESFSEPLRCSEVEGPGSAHHLLKHFLRVGGDPRRWLVEFLREHQITKADRVYHELYTLTEALYLMGTVDQINIPSLTGGERLCRRLASIIEAYSKGGAPNWRMAKYYDGNAAELDGIDPELRRWGVKKVRDENELVAPGTRGPGGDGSDFGRVEERPAVPGDKKGAKGGGKNTPAQPPKKQQP